MLPDVVDYQLQNAKNNNLSLRVLQQNGGNGKTYISVFSKASEDGKDTQCKQCDHHSAAPAGMGYITQGQLRSSLDFVW